MIVTETIPTDLVTWADIKAHIKDIDDSEKSYVMSLANACVEQFERETNLATAARSVSIRYSYEDLEESNCLPIPKGPVISITSVSNGSQSLSATDYELRQVGNLYYVYLYSALPTSVSLPLTLTVSVGHSTVPQSIKEAVLIHTETLWRNRGATSGQQQYLLELGLERIYRNYDTIKAVIG
jgi:uncharacterized phiE125 gp8 family phage protein